MTLRNDWKRLVGYDSRGGALNADPISFDDLSNLRCPRDGWICIDGLDRPLRYYVGCTGRHGVSPKEPAQVIVPPDNLSIMVWMHSSVPSSFRPLVLYHEAMEAYLRLHCGTESNIAHRIARASEWLVAERTLDEASFLKYKSWRNCLNDRSRPLKAYLPDSDGVTKKST